MILTKKVTETADQATLENFLKNTSSAQYILLNLNQIDILRKFLARHYSRDAVGRQRTQEEAQTILNQRQRQIKLKENSSCHHHYQEISLNILKNSFSSFLKNSSSHIKQLIYQQNISTSSNEHKKLQRQVKHKHIIQETAGQESEQTPLLQYSKKQYFQKRKIE